MLRIGCNITDSVSQKLRCEAIRVAIVRFEYGFPAGRLGPGSGTLPICLSTTVGARPRMIEP